MPTRRCSCWRRRGRCAAGGHVRVDIFYAKASPRRRALVDLLGALAAAAAVHGWRSSCWRCPMWRARGRCSSARARRAGCRWCLLLKTLIPIFAVLLALQGLAQAIRAWQVLASSRAVMREPRGAVDAAALQRRDAAAGNPRRRAGRRGLRGADGRLSGGADARRRIAGVRAARRCDRRLSDLAAQRVAAAHLRRRQQRRADRHSAVRVHGRDAGALPRRRGFARDHGPAVRLGHRRARDCGGDRRRAAGGGQGHRRRDHGDDGPDRAAGHAAPRLRPAACRRNRRGDRDAGADFSARDGAGAARRPDEQRLSGGATVAGRVLAAVGDGDRSVCRRDHSGVRAGRALSDLSDRRRGDLAADLARDPAGGRRAARPRWRGGWPR